MRARTLREADAKSARDARTVEAATNGGQRRPGWRIKPAGMNEGI